MILETIRMVSDGLAHATYGVNAQLQTLTLDGGDHIPSAVQVHDETRNAAVAYGEWGETYNAVLVRLDSASELDGEAMQSQRYGEISVNITIALESLEPQEGNAAVYYTLRAVQKSLRELLHSNNEADRLKSDVQLLACINLSHTQAQGIKEDIQHTGALRAIFKVCDITP